MENYHCQSYLDSLTVEEYEEHLANGGCPYYTPAGQEYYEQYGQHYDSTKDIQDWCVNEDGAEEEREVKVHEEEEDPFDNLSQLRENMACDGAGMPPGL